MVSGTRTPGREDRVNDQELHYRGKANEARSRARYALVEADRATLHREADEWDRRADEAAQAAATNRYGGNGTATA